MLLSYPIILTNLFVRIQLLQVYLNAQSLSFHGWRLCIANNASTKIIAQCQLPCGRDYKLCSQSKQQDTLSDHCFILPHISYSSHLLLMTLKAAVA